MGFSGWSTCQVFFENVKVPKEQLLGERNKGLKIALNTLNTGRIKLGAASVGVGKKVINHAKEYAKQREQFGKAISNFGAIKEKFGRMQAYVFGIESAVFRLGNDIDILREEYIRFGQSSSLAKINALKEFSIESAIVKVYGSEAQDYILDQGIQIYGGMGFSTDCPIERMYRSLRISRIYEGTNEINRLVIIKEFVKKGLKGELDVMSSFSNIYSRLNEELESFSNDEVVKFEQLTKNLKSLGILVSGICLQKFMQELEEQQEISMNISDIIIQIYVLESTLLRIQKLVSENLLNEKLHYSYLKVIAFDVYANISKSLDEIIVSFNIEDDASEIIKARNKYIKFPHSNIKESRRFLADYILD